jgi:hypothetical protein
MKKEYILVNLDKCFLDGSWEEVQQPKHLKKYCNTILSTHKSYSETIKILKKVGFKCCLNYDNSEKHVDSSYGVHLLEEILTEDRKKFGKSTLKKIIKEREHGTSN